MRHEKTVPLAAGGRLEDADDGVELDDDRPERRPLLLGMARRLARAHARGEPCAVGAGELHDQNRQNDLGDKSLIWCSSPWWPSG